ESWTLSPVECWNSNTPGGIPAELLTSTVVTVCTPPWSSGWNDTNLGIIVKPPSSSAHELCAVNECPPRFKASVMQFMAFTSSSQLLVPRVKVTLPLRYLPGFAAHVFGSFGDVDAAGIVGDWAEGAATASGGGPAGLDCISRFSQSNMAQKNKG